MNVRNVVFSLKMKNGQRNVKNGVKSIKHAILKSQNILLNNPNYRCDRSRDSLITLYLE
jgi:hypothetical protein